MQSQTQSMGALTGKACALGGPLHRQRGSERGRIEWVNGRKIQGGQARYFLFGKGVACSLALPASCGWEAVLNCYVFLCYLYFFHPHTKLPLVLRFLPSSSLLLWPSDFVGTWLLIYWGFQASQSLSILNPAISACNIGSIRITHLMDVSIGTIFIFILVQPPSPTNIPWPAHRSLSLRL